MKKICNVLTNSELNFIKMACRRSSACKEQCNLQAITGKGCWILLLASQWQPRATCINAVYNSLNWQDFKACNSKTNFLDLEESQYFHLKKKKLKVRLYYYFHVISLESFIFVLHELIPYSAVYTLMLGKIGSRRRRGWQRMRWLGGITSSMDMNLGKFCEMVRGTTGKHGVLPPMRVANSQTWLGDWTNPLFITDVSSVTS